MSNEYHYKMIMDPVHGTIGLSELETRIIDTPTFQRLRRLKQLGFASYVYPNASYSRFAHSLGVLYLASRVADIFERKGLIVGEEVKKLLLAALLHDVGHYPYSHLMEKIEKENVEESILQNKDEIRTRTQNKSFYTKHEDLGKLIITEGKDIRNLLENANIDPSDISALIEGNRPEITTILNKSLDVDRLDYLVRDSMHTGLPYGRVDINYILNNLDIDNKGEIVLRSKARIAAEHMLLARYFMFRAVYAHKTIFGFEELVRKVIKQLIERHEIYNAEDIEKFIRSESSDYLNFDDGYLDRIIDKYAYGENEDELSKLCKAIRHRNPPKLVYEVEDLSQRDRDRPSKEYTLFRSYLKKELEGKTREYDILPGLLFWGDTKDLNFEAANPFIYRSHIKDAHEGELKELVKLMDKEGNVINLIDEEKSIIHHLSQYQQKAVRLYAVGDPDGVPDAKIEILKEAIKQYLNAN